jgi:4,5-DOPA dioxygenase extradiol
MQYHFDLAKKLRSLRNEGVLIIGSGNIVHNLQRIVWEDGAALEWAVDFDAWAKEMIDDRDFDSLVHYEKAGNSAKLAVPTVDHYVPLLYCLSLADKNETIAHFYEEITYGSLSMRCLKIG